MKRDYTLEQHRAALLPGPGGLATGEGASAFTRDVAIIDAMTEADRAAPDQLTDDDRARIAAAAGVSPEQVRTLCEQFAQMRELVTRADGMTLWQRIKYRFGWGGKPDGGEGGGQKPGDV
jgi:signal recognition particle GTPase